jgi:hypothetical protein
MIQPEDTFISVASKFNITVGIIEAFNPGFYISNGISLPTGEIMELPASCVSSVHHVQVYCAFCLSSSETGGLIESKQNSSIQTRPRTRLRVSRPMRC